MDKKEFIYTIKKMNEVSSKENKKEDKIEQLRLKRDNELTSIYPLSSINPLLTGF